jgi:hypothetical protein
MPIRLVGFNFEKMQIIVVIEPKAEIFGGNSYEISEIIDRKSE